MTDATQKNSRKLRNLHVAYFTTYKSVTRFDFGLTKSKKRKTLSRGVLSAILLFVNGANYRSSLLLILAKFLNLRRFTEIGASRLLGFSQLRRISHLSKGFQGPKLSAELQLQLFWFFRKAGSSYWYAGRTCRRH